MMDVGPWNSQKWASEIVKSIFLRSLYGLMVAVMVVVGVGVSYAQLTVGAPMRSEWCSGRDGLRQQCYGVRRWRL